MKGGGRVERDLRRLQVIETRLEEVLKDMAADRMKDCQ